MFRKHMIPAAIAALCFATMANAQTAGMLSFQGLIKDADGNPVNGAVNLEFRIYDAAAGGNIVAGPFGPVMATPDRGIISTQFGPVAPSAFDGTPRWLEIVVDGAPLSRTAIAKAPAVAERLNIPATGMPALTIGSNSDVGLGTPDPSAALHIKREGPAIILERPNLSPIPNDVWWMRLNEPTADQPRDLVFGHGDDTTNDANIRFVFRPDGDVGIGTDTPSATLHLKQNGPIIKLEHPNLSPVPNDVWWMRLNQTSAGVPRDLVFGNSQDTSDDSIRFTVRTNGEAVVRSLQILGGADLAEPFHVTKPASQPQDVEPGMVVAIDPANPGQLKLATEPYDRKVAGVISGANGLQPGMVMKAEGHAHADGEHAVALTGRVWSGATATQRSAPSGPAID